VGTSVGDDAGVVVNPEAPDASIAAATARSATWTLMMLSPNISTEKVNLLYFQDFRTFVLLRTQN
jgi:hypothetical protein